MPRCSFSYRPIPRSLAASLSRVLLLLPDNLSPSPLSLEWALSAIPATMLSRKLASTSQWIATVIYFTTASLTLVLYYILNRTHLFVCNTYFSTHLAWYEWYPGVQHAFSGISFFLGDSVTVTVTTSSTTSGTAIIENTSTGQTVTQQISSSYTLCETNAEWIVKD